nr:MAG TPA: hypothetical protein [Bacteriophage sp.]
MLLSISFLSYALELSFIFIDRSFPIQSSIYFYLIISTVR